MFSISRFLFICLLACFGLSVSFSTRLEMDKLTKKVETGLILFHCGVLLLLLLLLLLIIIIIINAFLMR